MDRLHENFVLLTKTQNSDFELGIKKIINGISREIKTLSKLIPSEKENKEYKFDLKRWTFEKLLVQLLFDGPDLTFSPSRYNKDENFEDILENSIMMCDSGDQKTNLLTLISIYKSLNLDEKTIYKIIEGMHKQLDETIRNSQHKDDLVLSKINDLQGYWRK